MDSRKKDLLDIKSFTQNVETEVSMLLQNLQWDRKRLLEGTSTGICQYNANHRVPIDSLKAHESTCSQRSVGYTGTDVLLRDTLDDEAHKIVKFSNSQIQEIINEAANVDPQFKKGGVSHQPQSSSRHLVAYTADERRALYDAVIAAMPSCQDLSDLALASSNEDDKKGDVVKTRLDILAELRNMKRRRTKYRAAAMTKNFSNVLRDVIKSQMESYTEAVSSTLPKKAEQNLQSHSVDSELNKEHAKRNFSINKDGKYDSVKFRDYKAGSRQDSVARRDTFDVPVHENKHREKNFRKETSVKNRRHESHRDKDRNRDKEYNVEKPNEPYRSGNKYSRGSHESSHIYKKNNEDNAHRRESTDELKYRSVERRSYNNDDKYSENTYYKEDKFRKDIKVEPDDHIRESKSKNSSHRDRNRSRRSKSRDRHQHSKRRKCADDDYRKYGEHIEGKYKRDYEVKKEDP